jgi:hypothetical protein
MPVGTEPVSIVSMESLYERHIPQEKVKEEYHPKTDFTDTSDTAERSEEASTGATEQPQLPFCATVQIRL